MMGDKVIVAMSGGIDSSVSVYLMLKAGYDVIGVTLDLFEGSTSILEEAEKVAKFFNIPWVVADYKDSFKEEIISYFISTYRKGKTPNPCSVCNKIGKFNFLYQEMLKAGASKIVTGHYSRITQRMDKFFIRKGKDLSKDQSYYLSLLESFEIENLYFPLGDMTKDEIRNIAKDIRLPIAEKKDSQEVCFLKGQDYRDFLLEKIPKKSLKKGYFILNGEKIKKHEGIEFYTIGQRKGLGIGYHKTLYVKEIDIKTNNIILSESKNNGHKGVRLKDCVFNSDRLIGKGKVKLRYRMKEIKCMYEILPEDNAVLLLEEPHFAIAPGQIATIYDDDIVLGGGFIESVF
jgi:tRNA-specific 2-thiouridylase